MAPDAYSQSLAALEPLYREWNARINVVSRKDIDNLMIHHVLHSLAIARFVRFAPGTRLLAFFMYIPNQKIGRAHV